MVALAAAPAQEALAVVAPAVVAPAVAELAELEAAEPEVAVAEAAVAAPVVAIPAAPRVPLPSPAGHADRPRQFLRRSFVEQNDCAAPVHVLVTCERAAVEACKRRMWR